MTQPRFLLWQACDFDPEGAIRATGQADVAVFEHITISANGRDIEMIVHSTEEPSRKWWAVDLATFEREHTFEGPACRCLTRDGRHPSRPLTDTTAPERTR